MDRASKQTSTPTEAPAATSTQQSANSSVSPVVVTEPQKPPVAAPTPPPPWPSVVRTGYSLPWTLRPIVAPNLVRYDSSWNVHPAGFAYVGMLTAGGKPIPAVQDLGFYARLGVTANAPAQSVVAGSIANPLVLVLWTPQPVKGLRLGFTFAFSIPVGMGGDNNPDLGHRAANGMGIWTRLAMDNAMFAANYFTPIVGFAIAYVDKGWTVQAEATVLQLIRVRGDMVDRDPYRTNFTTGLHVGYRIVQWLTASLETHYQHWIYNPTVTNSTTPHGQWTVGLGVRGNIPLSPNVLFRPGFAYFEPILGVMGQAQQHVLQLDLALAL